MNDEDQVTSPADERLEQVLNSFPELLEPREPGFRGTLRSRIYRREVASEMGHLSWSGLWGIVLEYLGALLSLFLPPEKKPPEKGD
jgi:hypothetical protein